MGDKDLYPEWQTGLALKTGDRYCRDDGELYKCHKAHTTQTDWTPDITSALWTVIDANQRYKLYKY